ncbi:protein S100-A11 [Gadus morhua]|nr:protein S100-A11-like [Gadus morhua]
MGETRVAWLVCFPLMLADFLGINAGGCGSWRKSKRRGTHYQHQQLLSSQNPIPTVAMEAAINVLVSQFKTHAGKDGAATTLSKEEFHSLVKSDLPNLVKNSADPAVIDRLMSSLDENNDGELTFNEFWQLIGTLAGKQAGLTQ